MASQAHTSNTGPFSLSLPARGWRGAFLPKRRALRQCSPGQGRSRRSVLYWVTCYFYPMPAFSGQIRSREQTKVSYIRSRAAAVPLSLSSNLPSSFTKLLKTGRASPKRGPDELSHLPQSKSSLLRRRQLSQDIMQMGKKKKGVSVFYPARIHLNGRAAGNIVSHAVDLTERPLRVFPQVTVWKVSSANNLYAARKEAQFHGWSESEQHAPSSEDQRELGAGFRPDCPV